MGLLADFFGRKKKIEVSDKPTHTFVSKKQYTALQAHAKNLAANQIQNQLQNQIQNNLQNVAAQQHQVGHGGFGGGLGQLQPGSMLPSTNNWYNQTAMAYPYSTPYGGASGATWAPSNGNVVEFNHTEPEEKEATTKELLTRILKSKLDYGKK